MNRIKSMFFVGTLDSNLENCEPIGYFEQMEDATIRIEANQFDMYENGCYPYVLVEEVSCNCIYPYTEVKAFYEWKEGKYQRAPFPKKLEGLCGFTVK